MKQIKRIPFYTVSVFFLSIILFSACKKDDPADNIRTPVAGLMAFNLSTDQPAVGISLSGNNLGNAALGYNSFTGNYLPIYLGSREVRSFDFNTGSTIAITNGDFRDSMYYSVFVLGQTGNYRNVVVQDNLDSLPYTAGKAYVRYINAIADSTAVPAVTLQTGETGAIVENGAYGTVSSFKQVNAGALTATVSNGTTINATRDITIEEHKIYTLLLSGVPGATDTTRAVQIKFIQNATITP